MTSKRRFPSLGVCAAAVVVLVAAVLLLAPVTATYVNQVGSDTVEFRTASCGPPVAALLGADPGLGGGSEHPIGGVGAGAACDAAAGKRVAGGLFLLLLLATGAWLAAVKDRKRVRAPEATSSAI